MLKNLEIYSLTVVDITKIARLQLKFIIPMSVPVSKDLQLKDGIVTICENGTITLKRAITKDLADIVLWFAEMSGSSKSLGLKAMSGFMSKMLSKKSVKRFLSEFTPFQDAGCEASIAFDQEHQLVFFKSEMRKLSIEKNLKHFGCGSNVASKNGCAVGVLTDMLELPIEKHLN